MERQTVNPSQWHQMHEIKVKVVETPEHNTRACISLAGQ